MYFKRKIEDECTFENMEIGSIFSFEDDWQEIWHRLYSHNQCKSIEEYDEALKKEAKEYNKRHMFYFGEDLYMLCWHGIPVDVGGEYDFHPKYISLKDGSLHDIIEEGLYEGHNYYSNVRVYDTCRCMEAYYDDWDDDDSEE